jgi:pyridoxine 5-phosphate synthase
VAHLEFLHPIEGARRIVLRPQGRDIGRDEVLGVHASRPVPAATFGGAHGDKVTRGPMTRLSVNINKLATLRNARGGNNPDVLRWAVDIQRFGAQGITIHPRPDERHIRRADARALRALVTTEYNIEGYPGSGFLDLVLEVRPEQVTLVPDPPGVLTSNAGWDTRARKAQLREVVARLQGAGIRTSLFMGTDEELIAHAADTGADRIELYTEPYAEAYARDRQAAVAPFVRAAQRAASLGLGLNAGHDLDLRNLRWFAEQVPGLLEVSIGHALICDALAFGMENTVRLYLRELALAQPAA